MIPVDVVSTWVEVIKNTGIESGGTEKQEDLSGEKGCENND